MAGTLDSLGFGDGYDLANPNWAKGGYVREATDSGGGSKTSNTNTGTDGDGATRSSSGGPTPTYPNAIPQFTWKLMAYKMVAFSNTSLNAVRYRWSFGVGESWEFRSSVENPSIYFPTNGTFQVALRAYNNSGDYVDTTQSVTVTTVIPACDFTYIGSGTLYYFTDTSTDIDSANRPYWVFTTLAGLQVGSSYALNPGFTFPGNGDYYAILSRGSFQKRKQITVDAEVVLSCDTADGASGYKWEVSANGIDGWTEVADTALPNVGLTAAGEGIVSTNLNFFRVRAYSGAGDGDYSSTVSVTCS
jgi:hypothetical protein